MQGIILFWTGVTLLYYTLETWRLRKVAQEQVEEAQRQTGVLLRPFVIAEVGNFGGAEVRDIYRLYPDKDDFIPPSPPQNFGDHPYEYYFRIRNVGNGTAINVRVRDREDKSVNDTIEYFPIVIPVLSPGEKLNLHFEPYEGTDPLKSTFACTVRVCFENVEGGKYFIDEKIVGGQLEIIDSKQL
jgi:hypothetical protein